MATNRLWVGKSSAWCIPPCLLTKRFKTNRLMLSTSADFDSVEFIVAAVSVLTRLDQDKSSSKYSAAALFC